MTFVTPMAGLAAAAIAAPLLLLLYFLRLRRRPLRVSSTMLWDRAVEDLHANAPFQRIRPSLLLLLQMLALLVLALSLMQPQVEGGSGARGRHVILIDRSGSMCAFDANGTQRIAQARDDAIRLVDRLHGGGLFAGAGGETMVIAFSDTAEVVAPFTDSAQQLVSAIRSIEPTHGRSTIDDALHLARAYLTNVDPEQDGAPASESATIELFSDGLVSDLDQQALQRGESLHFHRIGNLDATNVAIEAIDVQRPQGAQREIQVFASIANHDPQPRDVDLELALDGAPLGVQRVSLPGGDPGKASVVFLPIELPGDGVVTLSLSDHDGLEIDDVARLVVPPPRSLRVLLAEDGSPLLQAVLEGLSLAALEVVSPSQLQQMVADGAAANWDLVVARDVQLGTLPPGRYLLMGPPPMGLGVDSYAKGEPQVMVAADEDHDVMRFVRYDDVVTTAGHAISPQRDVAVLLEGSRWPAVLAVDRGGVHLVHVAFDPLDSNWPYLRSFPFFVFNAIDHLGRGGDALTGRALSPGDALALEVPVGTESVRIGAPSGAVQVAAADGAGHVGWGPLRFSGLYDVSWGQSGHRRIAVNAIAEESAIAAVDEIVIGAVPVAAASGGGRVFVQLWPWAIGLVLVVLMVEWWLYQRKVT